MTTTLAPHCHQEKQVRPTETILYLNHQTGIVLLPMLPNLGSLPAPQVLKSLYFLMCAGSINSTRNWRCALLRLVSPRLRSTTLAVPLGSAGAMTHLTSCLMCN